MVSVVQLLLRVFTTLVGVYPGRFWRANLTASLLFVSLGITVAAYAWQSYLDSYPLSTFAWLVGSLLIRIHARHHAYFLASVNFFLTGVWLQLLDPGETATVLWLGAAVVVCTVAVFQTSRPQL